MKKTRKIPLSTQAFKKPQIRSLLENYQDYTSYEDPNISSKEEDSIDIIPACEDFYGIEVINRPHEVSWISNHHDFVEAFGESMEETGELDYVSQRVLANESIALHYLFLNNGIEQIANNYERKGQAISTLNETELKVEATYQYLQNLRYRNETIPDANYTPRTSIGMEYEYRLAEKKEGESSNGPTDFGNENYQVLTGTKTTPGLMAELGGDGGCSPKRPWSLDARIYN